MHTSDLGAAEDRYVKVNLSITNDCLCFVPEKEASLSGKFHSRVLLSDSFKTKKRAHVWPSLRSLSFFKESKRALTSTCRQQIVRRQSPNDLRSWRAKVGQRLGTCAARRLLWHPHRVFQPVRKAFPLSGDPDIHFASRSLSSIGFCAGVVCEYAISLKPLWWRQIHEVSNHRGPPISQGGTYRCCWLERC